MIADGMTPAEWLRHREFLDLPAMRLGAEMRRDASLARGETDPVADDLIGLIDAIDRIGRAQQPEKVNT